MLNLSLPHDIGDSVYHLYANKIYKRPITKIDITKTKQLFEINYSFDDGKHQYKLLAAVCFDCKEDLVNWLVGC